MERNNNLIKIVELLNSVLILIEYADYKDKFIDKYINLIFKEVFLRLTDLSLKFRSQINKVAEYSEMQKLLETNFDKKEIEKLFYAVAKNSLEEYFDAIKNTITEEKRIKVKEFVESF